MANLSFSASCHHQSLEVANENKNKDSYYIGSFEEYFLFSTVLSFTQEEKPLIFQNSEEGNHFIFIY